MKHLPEYTQIYINPTIFLYNNTLNFTKSKCYILYLMFMNILIKFDCIIQ